MYTNRRGIRTDLFSLKAFSDTLRRELRGEGIRVVALEPYFAQTNILKAGVAPDEERRRTLSPKFVQGIELSLAVLSKVKLMTAQYVADVVIDAIFTTPYPVRRLVAMPIDRLVVRRLAPQTAFISLFTHHTIYNKQLSSLVRLPGEAIDYIMEAAGARFLAATAPGAAAVSKQ